MREKNSDLQIWILFVGWYAAYIQINYIRESDFLLIPF